MVLSPRDWKERRKNVITAEMIHLAYLQVRPSGKPWEEVSQEAKAHYEKMAVSLNEQHEETYCSEQEYVSEVLRTCAATGFEERFLLGVMGLAGEAGEVVDLAKKARFQGHSIDIDTVKDELGDVMWYLGLLCHTLGLTLEEVRAGNVAKMHRRYPNGFEVERSVTR